MYVTLTEFFDKTFFDYGDSNHFYIFESFRNHLSQFEAYSRKYDIAKKSYVLKK